MTGVLQDLRYALRGLTKNPAFAFVSILTLALGIGANTAMFSVLNAVLLRPLPYPSPEELAMLWTQRPTQNLLEGRSTFRDVEQWRANSKTLDEVGVYDPMTARLTAPGEMERISAVRLSPSVFTILGVQPFRGRVFTNEEAEERRRVAVLSYRFWQSRFGAADNVIGSTIELDGIPSEVIGILPADFRWGDADVWEPHTLFPDWNVRRGERGDASWFVLARFRRGVTPAQAQTELTAIARRLDEQRPASDQGRGINVVPLRQYVVGPQWRLALWILTGAVFLVLLIGVTNITSLSLARSAGREREFALRAALGASRGRMLRQLFTESFTLAVLSGVAGVAIAWVSLPVIIAFKPAALVTLGEITLDTTTLLWTLGLSILTGILVGSVPAITSGRWNLQPSLHEASRGSSVGGSARLTRRALVVAEFALAIVLLVGAGLLTRSLINVQHIDLGFSVDRVLAMGLAIPPLDTAPQRAAYYQQVLERVEATGGVESAAVIGDLFINASPEQVITVEGSARDPERLRLRRDEASSDIFKTLSVPLLRGRLFSSQDGPNAPRVAIVNETMAGRLWTGEDPIGKRFKIGTAASEAPWFTVVGVVGDMRRQGLENDPAAQMFEPVAQNPSRLATLLVRTSIDPASMLPTLRSTIRQVDSRGLPYGGGTLYERLDAFQAERRFQTSLLTAFSMMALLLAAIGIYGVIQYSIATRTREIGIRMAVGAQRRDILGMVLGEGLKLSLAGVALGLVGALALGHVGSSLLFGVSAADPITYGLVSLLLTAVAAAGCYFPARRASRVDPLVALKYE
jgi:putative ABC transport system permease protein